jgi:wfgR
MEKVLFVSGMSGNGGTQTWTREYLKLFHSKDFELYHVNLSSRRSLKVDASILERIKDGLLDLRDVYFNVKEVLHNGRFPIMHAATSGSLGTLRDYFLVKLAHRYNTKGILHCHYGCISEDYNKKGLLGWLLRKTLNQYDQIWVLDSHSESFLKSFKPLTNKVFLTPNFIDVKEYTEIVSRDYKKIAFIGNIIPTKGVFELTSAVKHLPDTELLLIGPADSEIQEDLKLLIGNDSPRIKMLGRMDNNDVVKLLAQVDIVALPTYYPWEAFPISILEAMTNGCLVISCARAAIPDMLTDTNGNSCGLLVEPKSDTSIADAIKWCQDNRLLADKMRLMAHNKVKQCYASQVVFNRYATLYKQLV